MKIPVKVYQLPCIEANRDLLFRPYDLDRPVDGSRYELVWNSQMDVPPNAKGVHEVLDMLYAMLNMDEKPYTYAGHSLSVSDVIVLSYDDGDKIAYVDSFAFAMLDRFECNNVSKLMQPAIRVLIVKPGETPKVADIPNTLEAKQRIVGGLIEMTTPPYHKDTAVIICNEEGKILDLEPNRGIMDSNGEIYDVIYGTFIIVDAPVDSEDFGSLSDEQLKYYTELYAYRKRGWYYADPKRK